MAKELRSGRLRGCAAASSNAAAVRRSRHLIGDDAVVCAHYASADLGLLAVGVAAAENVIDTFVDFARASTAGIGAGLIDAATYFGIDATAPPRRARPPSSARPSWTAEEHALTCLLQGDVLLLNVSRNVFGH